MFNIINVKTQQPVAQAPDGLAAANIAQEWFNRTGIKHRPEVIVDKDWFNKYCEKNGGYYKYQNEKILPHYKQYNKEFQKLDRHYLVPDFEHPGEILFFENDIKGTLGIKTRMKYGVYLERFLPMLGKNKITEYATEFNGMHTKINYGIADTSEKIAEVFQKYTGGYSCCTFPNWEDGAYPSCIIDPAEIQVAYIEVNGKYTARTLVRSKTHEFEQRIKGDPKLEFFLKRDEWKPVNPNLAWVGVRANKILGKYKVKYPKGLHLDYFNTFDDMGDYLIFKGEKKGNTEFMSTSGYASRWIGS